MSKRIRTKYPGVFCIETTGPGGRRDRAYYVHYRKNGRLIEEKVGSQRRNGMTPAAASGIRADRIEGKAPSNRERREAAAAASIAEHGRWTIARLWDAYRNAQQDYKGFIPDYNRFKKHIGPAFGAMAPADISPMDIDRLRLHLGKTRKPQTVRNVLELLRRIINYGVDRNLVERLGFRIKMPTVNNERTESLSPAELTRLLKVLNDDPHRAAAAMMKIALFTGLRRGELFNLKWEDIDFERGFILLRDPKGGTDARVPLNGSAREVLLAFRPQDQESPFVFPGRGGRQRTDIHKAACSIRDRAGLPKTFRPFHGLRHAYASILASSGKVDMYTLQKLLTHKSPGMTQRYAHLRDEALKAAASVADDLIVEIRGSQYVPRQRIQKIGDGRITTD